MYYLGDRVDVVIYTWVLIGVLCFQDVYIATQAARGQLSHFNISTPLYARMFSLMALMSATMTFATLYIGWLFFVNEFPDLPPHYVWSIRLGIVLFVVFALQGFVMGARLSHTVGSADGGSGLPVLNWSKKFGDLRIAHFFGMHALQILPLASFYIVKTVRGVFLVATLYFLLALLSFIQAMQGKPLFR